MFYHNFKYAFKTLFRDKMLIFWTFAFPIILGTFFNMAFSNIENSEKLDIISIAIVEKEENEIMKQAFETLSDEENEDRLFQTQYESEERAKELLENDEITGYLVLLKEEPKVVNKSNGINETILKYVLIHKDIYPFEEERRLFYVGLTRTKNYCYLFVPKNNPSIFVEELVKYYKKFITIIDL